MEEVLTVLGEIKREANGKGIKHDNYTGVITYMSSIPSPPPTARTHTHTHTHMHACTHVCTHTYRKVM